eukprot:c26380_g1_i1.p1 GENE.c26380_g1_i1~~c26380_g1_i1.p1  ORF type:complete len:215 (+),score=30.26 c26380_g1_i1:44-688(+)
MLPLVLLLNSLAHPTLYPDLGQVNCSEPPAILSYHVHIIYMLTSDGQIARSSALRDKARAHFNDVLGEDCDGRYDNGRLCLIFDHKFNETLPGAPFPVGEWSMFVPVSFYARVVPWFTQNHGEFSLLVHPNSGCEYEDHSSWALWAGDKWPLDLSIFTPGTQTNEFNATLGDGGNPICVAEFGVCGGSDLGPDAVCCAGLRCVCPPNKNCLCTR